MKSMTGYGYAEYACDDFLMTMEVKSYNNRFLEISYYAPPFLSGYEQVLADKIKEVSQRGHIDASIKVKSLKGNYDISVDETVTDAYAKAISKILDVCKQNNLNPSLSISDFVKAEGVLTSINNDGMDKYVHAFDTCCEVALKQFSDSKEREGLATKKDLTKMIDSIDRSLSVVKKNVLKLDQMLKDNLISRLHEMLADQSYDENRILTEVAVMLVRYTINEETVRLGSHIAEFRRLLDSSDAVGKRMDFLSQEMNREINTIGSKSQMVEVNFEVVNMKDSLENIREQVRNIE